MNNKFSKIWIGSKYNINHIYVTIVNHRGIKAKRGNGWVSAKGASEGESKNLWLIFMLQGKNIPFKGYIQNR